jgi:hypothetical protein
MDPMSHAYSAEEQQLEKSNGGAAQTRSAMFHTFTASSFSGNPANAAAA